jgi:hypothetical protein
LRGRLSKRGAGHDTASFNEDKVDVIGEFRILPVTHEVVELSLVVPGGTKCRRPMLLATADRRMMTLACSSFWMTRSLWPISSDSWI